MIDNTNPQGTRVLKQEIAGAAIDVMRLVVESYEGTGRDAALSSGQVVAGKTGTSENYKDSWFCGITPQMSVALWMGDPSNVAQIPSSISVCSAFATFMNAYMEGRSVQEFPKVAAPTYTKKFKNADLDLTLTSPLPGPKDTTGMTEEEARALLSGHTVVYREAYSDTVPAGSVISQFSEDGMVVVVISKGPEKGATDPTKPGTTDPTKPDPGKPDPGQPTPDPGSGENPTPTPDPGGSGSGEPSGQDDGGSAPVADDPGDDDGEDVSVAG